MIAVALALTCCSLSGVVARLLCRRIPPLAPVAGALAVCLLSVFLLVVLIDAPFGSGTDEVVYHRQASGVSRSLFLTGGTDSQFAVLDEGKHGWPTLLGTLFWAAGTTSPYLGLAVTANITFLALVLVAAAGQRLYPTTRPGPAHVALLITAPAVLFFAVTLMREPLAWLSIAVALHAVLFALQGRYMVACVVLSTAVLLAFWVRLPLAVILAAAAVAALVVAAVARRFGTLAGVVSLALGFAVGLRVIVPLVATAGYSPTLLLLARDYLATISTTGFQARDPFTLVGMVEALVRVGLGPLPWEYRPGAVWVWVLGNHVHWLVVLVLVVLALRRVGVGVAQLAVLTFAVVLLAGIAVGLTNYGIVVRMRASVLLATVPLAWGALPLQRRGAVPPHDGDHAADTTGHASTTEGPGL